LSTGVSELHATNIETIDTANTPFAITFFIINLLVVYLILLYLHVI
jgi:hypothetical protein